MWPNLKIKEVVLWNISTVSIVWIYPKFLCIYGFVNKFWTGRILKRFGKCAAVRICPRIWLCGESTSKNAFHWFESVYRPENRAKRRNASTKFRKTSESEKLPHPQSRWGGRNLSKSPLFCPAARCRAVFVPASKSYTHHVMWLRFRYKTVCGRGTVKYFSQIGL